MSTQCNSFYGVGADRIDLQGPGSPARQGWGKCQESQWQKPMSGVRQGLKFKHQGLKYSSWLRSVQEHREKPAHLQAGLPYWSSSSECIDVLLQPTESQALVRAWVKWFQPKSWQYCSILFVGTKGSPSLKEKICSGQSRVICSHSLVNWLQVFLRVFKNQFLSKTGTIW